MIVHVLDTETGEVHVKSRGLTLHDWVDGNWSCDCNRGPNGPTNGPCRAQQYLVVAFQLQPGDEPNPGYTLADMNSDYDPELIRSYGLPTS